MNKNIVKTISFPIPNIKGCFIDIVVYENKFGFWNTISISDSKGNTTDYPHTFCLKTLINFLEVLQNKLIEMDLVLERNMIKHETK